jgi:N-acetylmuramoyl-L-alanine amidase
MNLKKVGLTVGSVATAALLGIMPASAGDLTVHPGDSLWTISRAHHISLKALESANPNVDPMNLGIGSVLNMPKSNSSSATSTATVDSNSVYWLAHLIHAEADGESYRAQLGVGDVVLHRVASKAYPDNVKDVVFQYSDGHFQFTCVQNGFIYTAPTTQNYQAARDVLEHHVDVVPGAEVFYNPSHTSGTSWVRQQPTIATIGSFVFAK